MGEDDFGGDVGSVRFVQKVAAENFFGEGFRIGSAELDIELMVFVDVADTDQAVFNLHEKIAVLGFPIPRELQSVAQDDLAVGVNLNFNSEAFSNDFCHG